MYTPNLFNYKVRFNSISMLERQIYGGLYNNVNTSNSTIYIPGNYNYCNDNPCDNLNNNQYNFNMTDKNHLLEMDKMMGNYEKKYLLSKSFDGNVQQQEYLNTRMNDPLRQNKQIDKWHCTADNYEKRNDISKHFSDYTNNYNSSDLNYLGVPRRTWN